jgi:hypothetical protein
MAITTLDGAIAGMQPPRYITKGVTGTLVAGRPHSTIYQVGAPGAAVAPAPGVTGAALTTYAGQIPFTNPVAGHTYLARMTGQAAQAGKLLLCDRLWHNSGLAVTTTTAQNVNSVALPPRDMNGSISGTGIYIAMEASANLGAGTPTLSMSYTNSLGVSGRTGAGLLTVVASSIQGTFYQMGLQAGDVGVQSIQTWTHNTTMTSGSISLVAYRVIASVDIVGAYLSSSVDALTGGFPEIFDDSVPFLVFQPSTTTTTPINSEIIFTQG